MTPDQPYDLGPRIDAHYALLTYVLNTYEPSGVALEFGVGSGQSTRIINSYMPVIGFDSFKGLPEDWREGYPKGMFAQDGPPDIPEAEFIIGLFEDTLPIYIAGPRNRRFGLVHIDCDLYSSTATVLENLWPHHLQPGTIVVFDEWHGYEGCEDHEQKAWREFAGTNDVTWEVLGHSFEQWAVRIT